MTEVVGSELHLEALSSEARRDCHDTRVGDVHVQTGGAEVVKNGATDVAARGEEVALYEGDWASGSVAFCFGDDIGAGLRIAAGEVDAGRGVRGESEDSRFTDT